MLTIRLSRQGKSKYATFRIVVIEKRKPPKGKGIEILGNYDPHKNSFNIDKERLNYWMSQGAKVSPTINNLLVEKKIIAGKKMQIWRPKKKKEEEKKVGEKSEIRSTKSETPKESDKSNPTEQANSKSEIQNQNKKEKKEKKPEKTKKPKEDKKTEEPKNQTSPRLEPKAHQPRAEVDLGPKTGKPEEKKKGS